MRDDIEKIKKYVLFPLKLITPGLVWVVVFFLANLITIFIDGDTKVLLIGGAYTFYIVIGYVILATIIAWLVNYLLWKLPYSIVDFYSRLLILFFQIFFLFVAIIIYFALVLNFVSGLWIWELKLKLTPEIAQEFVKGLAILTGIIVLISFVSNIIYNKLGAKYHPHEPTSSESDESSSFGDLIGV